MSAVCAKIVPVWLGVTATVGWFGLITQFYLIIVNRSASVGETIIKYFTFFTILSNVLVTICCTGLLFSTTSSGFFSEADVQAALAVYIAIVGITYNLTLRRIWAPQGLQRVVDELLHVVIPILFSLYWALFVPKNTLEWMDIFPWMIFPLVYLGIVLLRGAFSGWYPYPFINVKAIGYPRTLINCLFMSIAFIVVSLAAIAIGKFTGKA